MNKNRMALVAIENAKVYIEKAWPEDKELLSKIREILIAVCYKVNSAEKNIEHAPS